MIEPSVPHGTEPLHQLDSEHTDRNTLPPIQATQGSDQYLHDTDSTNAAPVAPQPEHIASAPEWVKERSDTSAPESDNEWLEYKITSIPPPDLSGIYLKAERMILQQQANQSANKKNSTEIPLSVTTAPNESSIQWPPGQTGRLAKFLFENSYSPVPEVAITAALGLLAGVCGRAYRTYTGKDLALYLILVARSGIGKDGIHEGIPDLIELSGIPAAKYFVRGTDYVSGEALHKELLTAPGFLNLLGEFGRKLKRMANPSDTPMQQLRTLITNAFGKRYLEGKVYSNSEKNVLGVDWPALSLLGETTPGSFLECLTPDMMADGFMSRFLVVSYDGGRPMPNPSRSTSLSNEDLDSWRALVYQAVKYQSPINTPPPCIVCASDDAREKLDSFERDCIENLNATEDEFERQVWSRAHLKAMKVACILAVSDTYLHPKIGIEHVAWALNLIRQDIEVFRSRNQSGDVGISDDTRERKLVTFMRDYIRQPPPPSYKIPSGMREACIVPRGYLQTKTSSLPAFANHKLGAKRAMDDALHSMRDNGFIMEVKNTVLSENYNFHGKAYRILKLPD
ncbi:DUF3987 domain-containing protein [Advenella sp. S44]|uniref:DUF3987 domain-containing protein n=1 Tax=Advenella sp. S44 TaxID=1982755 RepID=UPI00137478E6|nr:DUF3987 domain-containing protein [Advenella sp. S44]